MKRLQAFLLLYCLLILPTAWYFTQYETQHGLIFEDAAQAPHNMVFITRNDYFAAETVSWRGHLWSPTAQDVQIGGAATGVTTLTINGTVYTPQPQALETVALQAGYNAITIGFSGLPEDDTYFAQGLTWQTAAGQRLIPSAYLFPAEVPIEQAQRDRTRYRIWQLSVWVGVLLLVSLVIGVVVTTLGKFSTQHQLILLAIVGAQIAIGVIYYRDFLPNAPENLVYRTGSDHLRYVTDASNLLRGLWPVTDFYVQPGFSLSVGVLNYIVSPNIQWVHFAQFAAGVFFTFVLARIGLRLMPERPLYAVLATLLWTLIPMLPFYYVFALTHAVEAFASITIIYLWLRALQTEKFSLDDVLCGVAFGVAIVVRPTFLLLLPLVALSLMWVKQLDWGTLKPQLLRGIVIVGIAVLTVAPVTLYNYNVSGNFTLVSANGPVNIYQGNNTGAPGVDVYTTNFYYAQTLVNRGVDDYTSLALQEIAKDPVRWVQLLIRKAAFTFGNPETSSNTNFYKHAYNISWIIRVLPVRFGVLSILGLIGLVSVLGHQANWRKWLPVIGTGLVVVASSMAFFASTRFRVSLYPAVLLLATAGAVQLLDWRQLTAQMRRWLLIAAVISGTFVAAAPALQAGIVRPNVNKTPPATATVIDQPVSEFLTLHAYEVTEALPDDAQLIDLYWQVTGAVPAPETLNVSMKYVAQNGAVVLQQDRTPATGNHPDYPPVNWQVGQLVKDTHFVRLPSELFQTDVIKLEAVVYDKDSLTTYGVHPVAYFVDSAVEAQRAALTTDPLNVAIGPLTLETAQLTQTKDALAMDLYLRANAPQAGDGTLFIHIFDSADNFLFGNDSLLFEGFYPYEAWQPGTLHKLQRTIDLSALAAGDYTVRVGIYDPLSIARWPIDPALTPAAHQNVFEIKTISIGTD